MGNCCASTTANPVTRVRRTQSRKFSTGTVDSKISDQKDSKNKMMTVQEEQLARKKEISKYIALNGRLPSPSSSLMADIQYDMVMSPPPNDPMYNDLEQEMEIVDEWLEDMPADLPLPQPAANAQPNQRN